MFGDSPSDYMSDEEKAEQKKEWEEQDKKRKIENERWFIQCCKDKGIQLNEARMKLVKALLKRNIKNLKKDIKEVLELLGTYGVASQPLIKSN